MSLSNIRKLINLTIAEVLESGLTTAVPTNIRTIMMSTIITEALKESAQQPRWTSLIRPLIDTSNPTTTAEGRRLG
jgi:hypothetical protein